MAAGYFAARLLTWKSAAIAHRVLVTTLACLAMPLILIMVPGWKWIPPTWMPISDDQSVSGTDVPGTRSKRSAPTVTDAGSKFMDADPSKSDLSPLGSTISMTSRTPPVTVLLWTLTSGLIQTSGAAKTFEPPASSNVEAPYRRAGRRVSGRGVMELASVVCRRLVACLRTADRSFDSCTTDAVPVCERLFGRITGSRQTGGTCGLKPWNEKRCSYCHVRTRRDANGVLAGPMDSCSAIEFFRVECHDAGDDVGPRTGACRLTTYRQFAFAFQCVFCSMWPNPFSWLSMQLLRRLRERACDEWALQKSTIEVKTYAQCLLEVVQRCQIQQLRIASAMAGKQELESRLRWLMSASRPRVDRPIFTAAMVAAVGFLGLTIATAQPTRPQPPTAESGEQNAVNADPVEPLHEVIVSKDPSPADPAISVAGIVTDPEGIPLAGMEVVLCVFGDNWKCGLATIRIPVHRQMKCAC